MAQPGTRRGAARDVVHHPPTGVLRRRGLGGDHGQLRDPSRDARQRGGRDACEVPPARRELAQGARGGVRDARAWKRAQPVLLLPREPGARKPRPVGEPVPRQGHHDHRPDAPVDGDPCRHRDDHRVRPGDAARDRQRVATWRLARSVAARLHVPAGHSLLLSRARRDPAVRGQLGPVPVRPGLRPRSVPGGTGRSSRARSTTRSSRH